MTCYVDRLRDHYNTGLRYRQWCHLIADTEDELHKMAKKLKLDRAWFQGKSFPHYDLTPSKRRQAVQFYGAIELEDKAFVTKLRELRDSHE